MHLARQSRNQTDNRLLATEDAETTELVILRRFAPKNLIFLPPRHQERHQIMGGSPRVAPTTCYRGCRATSGIPPRFCTYRLSEVLEKYSRRFEIVNFLCILRNACAQEQNGWPVAGSDMLITIYNRLALDCQMSRNMIVM